jgi:hypothetical protein
LCELQKEEFWNLLDFYSKKREKSCFCILVSIDTEKSKDTKTESEAPEIINREQVSHN